MLRAFFACPNGAKQDAYAALFAQLRAAHDQTVVAVINTILTAHTETLLVPETFSLTVDDKAKIKALRKHTKECLVSSSDKVFDLVETSQAVPFVEL